MRLIDTDDVISLLTHHHFDNDKENFDLLIHNLCNEVKCIPIAYDVDKVVGRLKKRAISVTDGDEHTVPESNAHEVYELEMVVLSNAIEIVKRGGIDVN